MHSYRLYRKSLYSLPEKGRTVLQSFAEKIKKRRRYTYSSKNIFYSAFSWWWCLRKFTKKRFKELELQRLLYDKGLERLNIELDWTHLIESLRKLQVVVDMIMDEHQQTVLNFHKQSFLTSGDTSTSLQLNWNQNTLRENHKTKVIVPYRNSTIQQRRNFEERVDEFIESYRKRYSGSKDELLWNSAIWIN